MAHIDYLRVGTWDLRQYTLLASQLMLWRTGWKAGSFLQYSGHKNDGLFFGTGKQGKKSHYIFQVSGGLAQTVLDDPTIAVLLSNDAWYCTRIDIQRTNPLPEWWNVRDIADSLRQDSVNCSFVESDTGTTLYIGSRTSEKFIRIYTKQLDKAYLRFEYEIKGDLARAIYRNIYQTVSTTPTAVFNGLVVQQRIPQYVKSYYLDRETESIDIRATEHAQDQQKRLDWLLSLEDTIRMMMADHDIGAKTRTFVNLLATYGSTLDTDTTSGVSS